MASFNLDHRYRNFQFPHTNRLHFFKFYWCEKELHQEGAHPIGMDFHHREKKSQRFHGAGLGSKVPVDAGFKHRKVLDL